MARPSIKLSAETRNRLQALKRPDETWDDCLTRLAEYAELVNAVE